jgi:dynein heavy chain
MRTSLCNYFAEAVAAYEEKPREQWLFDYPAQVSLCGTQIWWTTEVNIAFSRLEEGYENAIKDYQKKQVLDFIFIILCRNYILRIIGLCTRCSNLVELKDAQF